MKLTAYQVSSPCPIRPAPVHRDWIDMTPEKFGRRCLPMMIANQHGWMLHLQERVTAEWNGSSIQVEGPAVSHFGSGILTFHVPYLFRTDEGNLWVKGPTNFIKDGIQALEGIVETDWSPMTFTMNWKFTRTGQVVFEKDEPFCMIVPIPRGISEVETEIEDISANPELQKGYDEWNKMRRSWFSDRQPGWQKHYHQGKTVGGEHFEDHERKLRLNEFRPQSI